MRFSVFENGSCWVKADFHLHTDADKEFRYVAQTGDYYTDYVNSLKNANIGVGAITNHNKFDIDEFKELRKKAHREGIHLLPGIELSVKDGERGVHTLVIFSDEWFINQKQTNHIQNFLMNTFAGADDFENENARSNDDIEGTIEKLDIYGFDYFIIFAHVEEDNGLWGGLSPGRIKDLFELDIVRKRCLGFQKVSSRDNQRKISQQLGKYYPAEVEGCDAKNLADMGSRKKASYLKLGDYSFEAVQFALRDFPNRVSKILPSAPHSHIKRITFEGDGTLGGTTINLSCELNALIGIRGSGKSSILEGLRYALDIPLGGKSSDADYKNRLVETLLKSGGKITVEAVCRRGVTYKISRINGQEPMVFIRDEIQPGLSIRETILHNPIYFGQKDLSSTGEGFEKDLIEKLAGERLDPVRQEIAAQSEIVQDLLRNIQRLENNPEALVSAKARKEDLTFRLSFYKEHGVEEKLERQTCFDKDARYIASKNSDIKSLLGDFKTFVEKYEGILSKGQEYISTQNPEFMQAYFNVFDTLKETLFSLKGIERQNKETFSLLEKKYEEFTSIKSELQEEFAEIQRQLSEQLSEAGAYKINPAEFLRLTTELDETAKSIALMEEIEREKSSKNNEISKEFTKLENLWLKEYQQITAMLDVINNSGGSLKIKAVFMADKKAMQECLSRYFTGSNVRQTTYQSVVMKYTSFGEMWADRTNINRDMTAQYEVFQRYLEKNIVDIITWQPPNTYEINFRGKPLTEHSLGQRASALMLFVLKQKNNDIIIIDQPEDDLDNQTIYDDVIKLIHTMKPRTQFIFATHNANIPVLGDAECVHSCVYNNGKISTKGGGIDHSHIQKEIIAVMEGGKEAFERRRSVYGSWVN